MSELAPLILIEQREINKSIGGRAEREWGLLWLLLDWWVSGGLPPMAPPRRANKAKKASQQSKGSEEIPFNLNGSPSLMDGVD